MKMSSEALAGLLQSMENAARRSGRPCPRLLAVSKTQPAEAVARLAEAVNGVFVAYLIRMFVHCANNVKLSLVVGQ